MHGACMHQSMIRLSLPPEIFLLFPFQFEIEKIVQTGGKGATAETEIDNDRQTDRYNPRREGSTAPELVAIVMLGKEPVHLVVKRRGTDPIICRQCECLETWILSKRRNDKRETGKETRSKSHPSVRPSGPTDRTEKEKKEKVK